MRAMLERGEPVKLVMALNRNAVDWASRPARGCVLTWKPFAIKGATPGRRGSAWAQAHLRDGLAYSDLLVSLDAWARRLGPADVRSRVDESILVPRSVDRAHR